MPGIKLPQGEKGEIVSLQDETSPCSELKEKFKCVEYKGKDARLAETSPKNQENFSLIQISSIIPGCFFMQIHVRSVI